MHGGQARPVPLAFVESGHLICWNCRAVLIAGYADLVPKCGPVPYFTEMTMECLQCGAPNRTNLLLRAQSKSDAAVCGNGETGGSVVRDAVDGE
jgi:hypothetical protein